VTVTRYYMQVFCFSGVSAVLAGQSQHMSVRVKSKKRERCWSEHWVIPVLPTFGVTIRSWIQKTNARFAAENAWY